MSMNSLAKCADPPEFILFKLKHPNIQTNIRYIKKFNWYKSVAGTNVSLIIMMLELN